MQKDPRTNAETRDRTGDVQIFSLTLSQLSYLGLLLRQAEWSIPDAWCADVVDRDFLIYKIEVYCPR